MAKTRKETFTPHDVRSENHGSVTIDLTDTLNAGADSLLENREPYEHALPSAGQGGEPPDDLMNHAPNPGQDFYRD